MFLRKKSKSKTSYDFGRVEASVAKPAAVGEAIRELLRVPDVWASVESYLKPPGECGSKSYDQANVIRNLLEWDQELNGSGEDGEGRIPQFGLSDRDLWTIVYRELPKAGFKVSQGRIVGLLEHTKTEKLASEHNPGNGGDVE